jgi:hypothetical protein
MLVFFLALIGVTLWQFLPEFVFPFLSSLSFICWVAPNNPTANFIGGGLVFGLVERWQPRPNG